MRLDIRVDLEPGGLEHLKPHTLLPQFTRNQKTRLSLVMQLVLARQQDVYSRVRYGMTKSDPIALFAGARSKVQDPEAALGNSKAAFFSFLHSLQASLVLNDSVHCFKLALNVSVRARFVALYEMLPIPSLNSLNTYLACQWSGLATSWSRS